MWWFIHSFIHSFRRSEQAGIRIPLIHPPSPSPSPSPSPPDACLSIHPCKIRNDSSLPSLYIFISFHFITHIQTEPMRSIMKRNNSDSWPFSLVCLCLCVCVCLSVCLSIFSVPWNRKAALMYTNLNKKEKYIFILAVTRLKEIKYVSSKYF